MWGLAAMLVGFAASASWAQDAAAKAADRAIAAADPDVVDPSLIKGEKWTLDFTFERPELIVVTEVGGQKQVYWYMVYTVTNNTGAERTFAPVFTMYTNTGEIRRSGLYPGVFDAIKKTRKVRFLEDAAQVVKKDLLVGPENAKTGVAIFAPIDAKTTKFTIFAEGLSGELIEKAAAAAPPTAETAPPTPETLKPVVEKDGLIRLRKTLALSYDLPPGRWWLSLEQPVFQCKKWTWR
jgi:hypothetical protein